MRPGLYTGLLLGTECKHGFSGCIVSHEPPELYRHYDGICVRARDSIGDSGKIRHGSEAFGSGTKLCIGSFLPFWPAYGSEWLERNMGAASCTSISHVSVDCAGAFFPDGRNGCDGLEGRKTA